MACFNGTHRAVQRVKESKLSKLRDALHDMDEAYKQVRTSPAQTASCMAQSGRGADGRHRAGLGWERRTAEAAVWPLPPRNEAGLTRMQGWRRNSTGRWSDCGVLR